MLNWVSTLASCAMAVVAVVSAAIAFREYRLASLRRLADKFEAERYRDRFWRLSEVLRQRPVQLMLYPNERTGRLEVWTAITDQRRIRLVAEMNKIGFQDAHLHKLATEALGPGFTNDLRADLQDFYALVRRVADWIGLYGSLRGEFWETGTSREWRTRVGESIYQRATRRNVRPWHSLLRAGLCFCGFLGRRIGFFKRRRAQQVLRMLGPEFVAAIHDHRLLVSRLFICSDVGESGWQRVEPEPGLVVDQDYFLGAYGLYDYGYTWLTTVLWEVGGDMAETLNEDFFELRELEAALVRGGIRHVDPWLARMPGVPEALAEIAVGAGASSG